MGWSLDYQKPREPELLDRFFLAVGKSLYLASAFEAKCQWVLRIVKMASHYERTGDASATVELTKALKDRLLGPTLNEMKGFPEFNANDIGTLERAKDARNYIAHESAEIGSLSSATKKVIREKLIRLRDELDALVRGDNVISSWVYEITEKEPAPRGIQSEYPEWVSKWVFGHDAGT